MTWRVSFTKKAFKQGQQLPNKIKNALNVLIEDLRESGPVPSKRWSNYGKLKARKQKDLRHCHLNQGKTTYVCCWEVVNKQIRLLEVYYVGTHEKAPY